MTPNSVHILLVGAFFPFLLQVHLASTRKCETENSVRYAFLGGTETIKGEWPFIAAIHNRSNYICGGTIISNRHILTAAHCMQRKNSEDEISSDDVVVRLGAHNLTDNNEKGVVQRNVSAIIVHPDWKDQAFEKSFDADIAILVLSENITFTDYIQPVRMPGNGNTENMEGTLVGYSMRIKRIRTETPRRIVVRAVNRALCFQKDNVVANFSSERTFCGGNGDGSPDLGDSGSGYFFAPGFSWAQYGILSIVHTNGTGHISPHMYHLYTNVTVFKDWIVKTVNETGGVVGEARISVTMKCDFDYTELTDRDKSVYNCRLYNIDIQGNNFETSSFVGAHLFRKTQRDVEEIDFVNGTMSYIPSGFGLFFENIKHMTVGRRISDSTTLGTKVVRRSNLQNLRNLLRLSFFRNDIHTMHENATWDLHSLQSIEFIHNKLEVLFNETFSKNKKLVRLDFHSNRLNLLPANLFRNNPLLESVDFRNNFLKAIDEKIFKTNRRLSEVSFGSNKFEVLPDRLFRNNLLLVSVDFRKNFLQAIDDQIFETNRRLRSVDFSSNRLEMLPRQLFRNSLSLDTINFENNVLLSIDEHLFETNAKLANVDFKSNRIESLPQKLFRNNLLLVRVDFRNNLLQTIDGRIFEANGMLKSIDFASNRFEMLPKRLFRNSLSLHTVNFENNALSSIDEHLFETNAKLENVDFKSNRIELLPQKLFRNNLLLVRVNFRNNLLKTINEKLFQSNGMLWSVDFGSNRLKSLPKQLFRNSLSLHTVNFVNNTLSSIDEELFQANVNLMVANFTSNRIGSLPRKLFRNNLRLNIVDFRNNSIMTIDENVFVNNRKLYLVGFAYDRLERLQKNVFESTSLLDMLDLKTTDTDLIEFEHVCAGDVDLNNCVSAPCCTKDVRTSDFSYARLAEFQSLVMANCSNEI